MHVFAPVAGFSCSGPRSGAHEFSVTVVFRATRNLTLRCVRSNVGQTLAHLLRHPANQKTRKSRQGYAHRVRTPQLRGRFPTCCMTDTEVQSFSSSLFPFELRIQENGDGARVPVLLLAIRLAAAAGYFFLATFFAGAFFATTFLAGAFLTTFLAATFFAGAFLIDINIPPF